MSLEKLCQLVEEGETAEGEALAHKLLEEGVDPVKALNALMETMAKVGEQFACLEIFLPEMMMIGETMMAVVKILKAKMLESGTEQVSKGKVVMGTVKGDVHEIGKSIVAMMLEAGGFEVSDLGYDVDPLAFIKEAQAIEADIIGASSLMTTTMPHQKEIIDLLKDRGLRDKFKVVIGGAPTSPEWAKEIGADLFCPDAGSASKMLAELINN